MKSKEQAIWISHLYIIKSPLVVHLNKGETWGKILNPAQNCSTLRENNCL
jgi:hypothetical protein